MTRVVVDDALSSQLNQCRTTAEICNKDGRILGVFTPTVDPDRECYEWAKSRLSDEELERRCNEPGEKTTAEVLNALHGT